MCENPVEPKYIYDLNKQEKDILIRFRLLSEEDKKRVLEYTKEQIKKD